MSEQPVSDITLAYIGGGSLNWAQVLMADLVQDRGDQAKRRADARAAEDANAVPPLGADRAAKLFRAMVAGIAEPLPDNLRRLSA